MYCNTLQQAATHSSTHSVTVPLFPCHTATHCNTLQLTATHCNTLQHTAVQFFNVYSNLVPLPHRNRMYHVTTYCNTLQPAATHVGTGFWSAQWLDYVLMYGIPLTVVFCILQHTATHCNTLQHKSPWVRHHSNGVLHTATPHHTLTHCNAKSLGIRHHWFSFSAKLCCRALQRVAVCCRVL